MCGGGAGAPNQSPIDLKTKKNTYPTFNSSVDKTFTKYTDQTAELSAKYSGHYLEVDMTPSINLFESEIAKKIFGDKQEFTGFEFRLKSPSEHTIDGVRFDIELQIIHNGDLVQGQVDENGNVIKASFDQSNLSILFSQDTKYKFPVAQDANNKALDDFFVSLELTNQADITI